MDKKYYICQADWGADGCPNDMTGKAMTISAWKNWAIKTKLDDLFGVGLIFDNNAMVDIANMSTLEEEKTIEYIRDYYDMRIIPLEDNTKKYIDMDANGKLMTEEDVRKMCLELEQSDLYNNFNDYKHNNLDLSIHFDWIKKCLYGDINDVLDEIDNFGAWIKQIEFIN